MASYTVTYQLDEAPEAVLASAPAAVRSLGVWVGDAAQYRFTVQPVSPTGKPGVTSPWATVRTALPAFSGGRADEDADLFDPTAELPCFPATNSGYPSYSNLIATLLLDGSLCGAQPQPEQWRPNPPLYSVVCPGTQAPLRMRS